MSKILVVGSTGNVGRALVEELARTGEAVRAATRDPSRFEGGSNLEPVRFDYSEPSTFAGALDGCNRVFLIGPPSPTPDGMMIPFLQEAVRENRKIVLMTAMGTEFAEGTSLRKVELFVEGSGAPFVILRPNWFMDNFHTYWLQPIQQAGVIPLPAADARTSLIDARDIGASAAAALTTDRFDGSGFTLTGPEAVTYAEAAVTLSAVAGREIKYVPVEDEQFVTSLVEAGAPADLATYLAMLFGSVREGVTATVSGDVEHLTGRAPHTLAEYARDHAAAWQQGATTA